MRGCAHCFHYGTNNRLLLRTEGVLSTNADAIVQMPSPPNASQNSCVSAPGMPFQALIKRPVCSTITGPPTSAYGITVSLPDLVSFTKKWYPALSVTVSKFARVASPSRARMWEDVGVDRICLDGNLTHRPCGIQAVRQAVGAQLVMLANDACVEDCPWENAHAVFEAVWSRGDVCRGYVSYYSTLCRYQLVRNKQVVLRSTYIRPEDLSLYKSWGIDLFKLVDRTRPTEWLRNVIKAYCGQSYDGNLADLLSLLAPCCSKAVGKKRRITRRNELDVNVVIRNKMRNGYLQHLADKRCDLGVQCRDCGVCRDLAERSIGLEGNEGFEEAAQHLLEYITDRE